MPKTIEEKLDDLFKAMFDHVDVVETDGGTVLTAYMNGTPRLDRLRDIRVVEGKPKAFRHITSITVKDDE